MERAVEPVIDMRGVTRRYGDVVAVRDLTLGVEPGTILGLIGPSGSGKTTVVRMLAGILAPSAGTVRVMGVEPRRFRRSHRERIAYMPQLFSLYPDLTVKENVGFISAMFGTPWWKRSRLIRRALEVVELWDVRHRRASDLSGGMQRRLELACAIVHDPAVLFVDEPTAGIDPILRKSIWDELRRLRDAGRTLLCTTQYVAEAEYCDNVALLATGELIAVDEPEELRRRTYGGDLLRVRATREVTPEALRDVAGITSVRQIDAYTLVAVTGEAGTSTPRITERLNERGIGVHSIEEYQPSFDDVFTELVARHRDGAVGVAGPPAAF
ncbi:MAG TPA: ABC transporter ATP-binding protein [Candidatus Limnocylindria bacterium]|nr:ABC transporter ATP-binding protein [Candidatus Limnocylindria bacterium]